MHASYGIVVAMAICACILGCPGKLEGDHAQLKGNEAYAKIEEILSK